MTETLTLRGTLEGHNGWVTQIATNPKFPDMILSSSRDKSLIVWKLTRDDQVDILGWVNCFKCQIILKMCNIKVYIDSKNC